VRTEVVLTVNGAPVPIVCDPADTLLALLRERLQLTGAKRGCNQGVCGACTVLLDGHPVRGCLQLAVACDGRAVTTIEGVGAPARLSAAQQALIDSAGLQCGYCTPGMVLTLTALLEVNPTPTRADVRRALAGNLCRCTGYTKIVDGAMLAAERMRS
jgi:carbon-monoxide dehydrogenase small subunit